MEYYQLKTFVTVAKEGHLTRAANKLFISQPAVSAHIKALEEELGLILFTRTPKGMELTREGEILMEQAESALVTVNEIRKQAASLKKAPTGKVRLGIHIDPEYLKISEFFTIMQNDYPGLKFHMIQAMSWEVVDKIKAIDLDAGFIYGKSPASDISSLQLQTMNLCVVSPIQWADEVCDAGWKALDRFPWIGTPPPCPFHTIALNLFKKYELNPKMAAISDQEQILNTLAASGTGLTLMIEDEALKAEKENRLFILKLKVPSIELSFAYPKKQKNDPVIKSILTGLQIAWNL